MNNKSFRRVIFGSAISCLALIASPGIMAVDDTTFSDISLTFTEQIDIDAVGNVNLADPAPSTDAVAIEDFCIAGSGFSTFEILFESDDGNNDTVFELTNGVNTVPYSVDFDNSTGGPFTAVTEGTPVTPLTLNDIAANCIGVSDNARFRITILNADWQNGTILSGNNYTDILSITVTSL